MRHNIELTTSEVQYIRAALCRYRHSDHFPSNDIHFNVNNKDTVQKFNNILDGVIKMNIIIAGEQSRETVKVYLEREGENINLISSRDGVTQTVAIIYPSGRIHPINNTHLRWSR